MKKGKATKVQDFEETKAFTPNKTKTKGRHLAGFNSYRHIEFGLN